MLLYQQFFYFLIGLGVLLGLPALWMFARGMWPDMVERRRDVASRRLVVNFLSGLPVVLLIVVMVGRVAKFGQFGFVLAFILVGLLLMWGLLGASGLAAHVGSRLWPALTGDESWRAMLRGSFVVSGVLAIPFIGWFILLLVLIITGFGINVRSWFVRTPAVPVAPVAPLAPVA